VRARVVAFDLGGVLAAVDKRALGRSLGVPDDVARAAYFDGPHHDEVSRGHRDADAFVAEAARRLARPADDVARAWTAVVAVRAGAARLVAAVRAPLAVWSNTDPLHFHALAPDLPDALTDRPRALSYEVGALKPDPSFYEAGLAALDVPAADVTFLDDRADNVAAARSLGIDATRVDGVDGAARALIERGLLDATYEMD
jgi:HAD superfamily hydrolase (TIGR01509 family)